MDYSSNLHSGVGLIVETVDAMILLYKKIIMASNIGHYTE